MLRQHLTKQGRVLLSARAARLPPPSPPIVTLEEEWGQPPSSGQASPSASGARLVLCFSWDPVVTDSATATFRLEVAAAPAAGAPGLPADVAGGVAGEDDATMGLSDSDFVLLYAGPETHFRVALSSVTEVLGLPPTSRSPAQAPSQHPSIPQQPPLVPVAAPPLLCRVGVHQGPWSPQVVVSYSLLARVAPTLSPPRAHSPAAVGPLPPLPAVAPRPNAAAAAPLAAAVDPAAHAAPRQQPHPPAPPMAPQRSPQQANTYAGPVAASPAQPTAASPTPPAASITPLAPRAPGGAAGTAGTGGNGGASVAAGAPPPVPRRKRSPPPPGSPLRSELVVVGNDGTMTLRQAVWARFAPANQTSPLPPRI